MLLYRERLSPTLWMYVSMALVIPASLLVFLPINPIVGVISAVALYGGAILTLVITSPVITVDDSGITAGRAKLPVQFVGELQRYRGAEATLQRGRLLDARAWLVIRGWVDPVVKIQVLDADDPAPYWLVSTRRPERLIDAIQKAATEAQGSTAGPTP